MSYRGDGPDPRSPSRIAKELAKLPRRKNVARAAALDSTTGIP
jgi:hypothetical protein